MPSSHPDKIKVKKQLRELQKLYVEYTKKMEKVKVF